MKVQTKVQAKVHVCAFILACVYTCVRACEWIKVWNCIIERLRVAEIKYCAGKGVIQVGGGSQSMACGPACRKKCTWLVITLLTDILF